MEQLVGKSSPLGALMIDIEGLMLTDEDKVRLRNPLVAGVILFSRNFQSSEQLLKLTQQIHDVRHPKLLIAVDHEGGRVQRFREGFTRLPAMRLLGKIYAQAPDEACELARKVGWVMATELLVHGVDFSFAPVLDLDYGGSKVIGDRAFDSDFGVVGTLGFHLMHGMREAGMASVAKHFPGHGFIEADTHLEIATDERPLQQILTNDVQPFLKLIENDVVAVMPAHVIYPKVDDLPAGFSQKWIQTILRAHCHFDGVVISDDLSMEAAKAYGNITQRVTSALTAGCDLVLVCNDPQSANEVLSELEWKSSPLSHSRLIRLHGKGKLTFNSLIQNPLWQAYSQSIQAFLAAQNQTDLSF